MRRSRGLVKGSVLRSVACLPTHPVLQIAPSQRIYIIHRDLRIYMGIYMCRDIYGIYGNDMRFFLNMHVEKKSHVNMEHLFLMLRLLTKTVCSVCRLVHPRLVVYF